MGTIPETIDLSETGSLASMLSGGWTYGGGNVQVRNDNKFSYFDGTGGSYVVFITGQNGSNLNTPVLATPVSTFYMRFHFYSNAIDTRDILFGWYRSGVNLGSLRFNGLQQIELWSGGTKLATSTKSWVNGEFHTLEIGVTIGNAGTYELRIDGISTGWLPSAVGDTQPGSETNVDQFIWQINSSNNGGVQHWFDDIIARDDTWPGEGITTLISPNGAGTTTQLTPSTVPNWDCVNEVPPSDVDYVEADSVNLKDTYGMSNLPANAASVNTVAVVARVIKAGSAIGHAYPVARSGGTDYEGASHALLLSYNTIVDVLDADPATSAAWTVSAVNAMEAGIRFDV